MKILNFGSLNIDNVYQVSHFVQPGETVAALSFNSYPGGKGLNQSVALAKAGAEVYHAGKIGKDGLWLAELLKASGVNTGLIDRTGTVTGRAIIQVNSSGQNCIIINHGANGEITEEYIDNVLKHFHAGDIMLIQNEINSVPYIIDRAFDKGIKTVLNPSPIDSSILNSHLEKVTYFILNEIEGFRITRERKPDRIAETLLARYPEAKVVLTLGERGVMYKDREASYKHGIYKVPVVDTTGAGDTFTGYFLACITNGCSKEEALRLASVASSIAVSRKGAAASIPALDEVKNARLDYIS